MRNIETITPIDRNTLDETVRGITKAGKVIKKGLIGDQVIIVTTDQRVLLGTCEGFRAVNKDIDIKEPYLTIQVQETAECKGSLRLPPQCIVSIDRLES